MKLTVTLLLLVAACQAADVKNSRRNQKADVVKTDKRELEEGNAGVEKRAPVLPTALPSTNSGIEYAESKQTISDKSPSQQIYATPVPQIGKISDLLTGQGPPFQAAITSHLYSPISVYQSRLGAPTTYEVSPPIASQLAYSEHKISYQPPQNAIQYSQPPQYNQKLLVPKQQNYVRPFNFQQPYQQQIFTQPQQLVYSQQPQLVQQPIFQQIPQAPFPFQRQLQYVGSTAPQQFVEQPTFSQEQQNIVQVLPYRPGIVYAREEQNNAQSNEQPSQREQKTEAQQEPRTSEQQNAVKIQKSQPQESSSEQGATSYASFSQSQAEPKFLKQQRSQYQAQPLQQIQTQQKYQEQPQPQIQIQQKYQEQPQQQIQIQQKYQEQPQPQIQIQQKYQQQPRQLIQILPKYQEQPQYQQLQIQHQSQPQFQLYRVNPQIQYSISPQFQYQNPQIELPKLSQETLTTASSKTLPVNPERQLSYFRPGPALPQIQPQLVQHQAYQPAPRYLLQNSASQSLAAPSYPPVQYFGKFAQSIFGGSQQ